MNEQQRQMESQEDAALQANQPQEPVFLKIKNFEGKTVTLVPSLGLYSVTDFMGQAMPGLAIDLGIYDGKYNPPMPYTSLTVSFGEYISVPNSAYIDTNNFPFADQLLAQGIAEETGLKKTSGYCTYPLWVFKEEFLQKIGGEVYQEYARAIEQYDPFRDPFEDEGPEMDGDEDIQAQTLDEPEQDQIPVVPEQDTTRQDKMSVRQWQEKFRAGAFNLQDRYTQCEAGWYDWFCRDDALAGRLKKIGKVVMGITDPFILDNYYVWFKNNCPLDGPLYDDVRFEPLSGERDGKYFVVAQDSPHERAKWELVTERYGFDAPEFECGNIRDMVRYINGIGPQLRQGIKPPFIAEKDAVTAYALRRGEPEGIHIYREGNHNYSYISRQDRNRRTVMAVASLEDAPPGFAAEQAVSINGLHVFCPEDAGKPLPDPERTPNKSHKRKEPER